MFGGTTNVLGSKLGWADTGASTIGPSLPVVSTDDNFSIYSVAGLEAYYSTKDPADITVATGVKLWRDRSGKSNETLLACDGTNNGSPASIAVFGTTDFTVNLRLRAASLAAIQVILWGGANAFGLKVDTTGAIVVKIVGGSDLTASTTTITANADYYITYVRSGTTGTYYINGAAAGTTTDNNNYSVAVTILASAGGSTNAFAGTLQRPAIYNRALSAGEVAALYAAGGVPVAADYYGAGIGTAINAGSFVVGKRYRIASAGNTDFTLVGAANSNVGTEFVATGAGTGTGNATAIGLLAYWDFSTATRGAATVTDTSGNSCVLTTSTGARISGARDLYQGTAASQLTNLPWSGTNYGWLPGVNGNTLTTPLGTQSDFDISCFHNPSSYSVSPSIFGQGWVAGNRSFLVTYDATGHVNIFLSTDGTAATTYTSVAAVSIAAGTARGIRVTRNATSGEINVYESVNGASWGTAIYTVTGLTGALFASTSPLRMGTSETGGSVFNGSVFWLKYSATIGGAVSKYFNPSEAADGASSWVSSTGETWTVNTSGGLPATIVGRAGVLADGVNDYLKTAPFTVAQPVWFVGVMRQVVWSSGMTIWNGFSANTEPGLRQFGSTPNVDSSAGSLGPQVNTFAVGSTRIFTQVFNAASSIMQDGRGTPATGNSGTNGLAGFVIGARSTNDNFTNILYNELAIFSRAPSAAEIDRVVRYMARKWSINV